MSGTGEAKKQFETERKQNKEMICVSKSKPKPEKAKAVPNEAANFISRRLARVKSNETDHQNPERQTVQGRLAQNNRHDLRGIQHRHWHTVRNKLGT
jgi:hypothetical protein